MEKRIEVEPGYRVYHQSGDQFLEVTDRTAAGGPDGVLYHTRTWAEREAEHRAVWANRSWWRKLLNLQP